MSPSQAGRDFYVTDLFTLVPDLHNLKKINDSWGHHVGDEMILIVASTGKINALFTQAHQ